MAHYLSAMVQPIFGTLKHTLEGVTDSQSLYEALGTSSQVSDRRLRVEVSALRQMVEEGDVRVSWVPKNKQIADVLTKSTSSDKLLVHVLTQGAIPQ